MAATSSKARAGGGRRDAPASGARRRSSGPTWGQRIQTFFGIVLMLILIVTFVGIGYVAYLFRETAQHLPNPDNLIDYVPGGITEIYATDKDPKTNNYVLLGRVFAQNKEFIPITDIPKVLQNATVAIEDERFYSHPGIDIQGIARAAYKDIRSKRKAEGASTLTQQLARNVYHMPERTFTRKLQEAMLAMEIEKNYSKEQILEMYLNEVGYGGNNYGVRAASMTYFGKQPKDLTIAEAALIAGLPKNPNGYYPYRHLKEAVFRRNVVLGKMAELGYITPDQAKEAQKQKVHLTPQVAKLQTDFKAPYFTNYVLRELLDKYGYDTVYKGGLKVYTTLNWQMQQEAEKALIQGIHDFRGEGVTDGALVCIEPHTGFIRTMVGGKDFKSNQYNNVTQGRRQPGSSFKAFVYSAAFDMYPNRFGPDNDVNDSDRVYGKGYRPENHGGKYRGMVSARSAFAYSYNAAAVWLANEIGVKNVIDYAHRMGITSKMEPNLSLALGAYPMTPLEMCSAYTTFANGGSRAHAMAIRAVLDSDGVVLENNAPVVDQQVIKQSTCEGMREMMADVVDHGTAANAAGIHDIQNARGKTGTTNDGRDLWFIGYTPELTTAVWVCNVRRVSDKHGHTVVKYLAMENAYGGSACAPIWAAFMKQAVPIQRQAGETAVPIPANAKKAPKVAQNDSSDSKESNSDNSPPAQEALKKYSNAGYNTSSTKPSPSPATSSAPAASPSDSGTDNGNGDGATDKTTVPAANGDGTTASTPDNSTDNTNGQDKPNPQDKPDNTDGNATTKPAAMTAASNENQPADTPHVTSVAHRTRKPEKPAADSEDMVTVNLCADTGLRATRWCPETISKTLPRSEVPRGYCRKHKPMPGDG